MHTMRVSCESRPPRGMLFTSTHGTYLQAHVCWCVGVLFRGYWGWGGLGMGAWTGEGPQPKAGGESAVAGCAPSARSGAAAATPGSRGECLGLLASQGRGRRGSRPAESSPHPPAQPLTRAAGRAPRWPLPPAAPAHRRRGRPHSATAPPPRWPCPQHTCPPRTAPCCAACPTGRSQTAATAPVRGADAARS